MSTELQPRWVPRLEHLKDLAAILTEDQLDEARIESNAHLARMLRRTINAGLIPHQNLVAAHAKLAELER